MKGPEYEDYMKSIPIIVLRRHDGTVMSPAAHDTTISYTGPLCPTYLLDSSKLASVHLHIREESIDKDIFTRLSKK